MRGAEVMRQLFEQVLDQARAKGLLSSEHFSVDGTLIRAWASHKSFVPKDGPPPPSSGSRSNPEVDFRGKPRRNDTHESKTDPESAARAPGDASEWIDGRDACSERQRHTNGPESGPHRHVLGV